MADETAIDIVLEDDPSKAAPEAEAAKIAEAAAPEKKVIEPEEGIEELRAKLAEEKRRGDEQAAARQAAEDRANRAAQEAAQAKGEKQDGEIQLVENAINSLNQAQDRLTKDLEDAWAAGDYSAGAKIQREMSANEAKLLTLSNGLESLKATPKPQAKEEAGDPVETLAAQLTPRSASWIRSHPEYARDGRLYQRMLAAHNLAVTDGLTPESDEYFAAVEGTLGIGRQTSSSSSEDALSAAAQPTQRRSAPPAAPVGRGGGANPTRVTLTAEEVEMAEMMGMSREEYARNKVALQNEGRLH